MINEALATIDDITYWAPAGSCGRLQMLRLDKLHPVVSGNKWFKLRYNVEAALHEGKSCLLTFGGGYSNHLVATAFAAQQAGMASIGIVRGRYVGEHFTTTLCECEAYGMRLIMMSKYDYAALSVNDLSAQFPEAYIIPEGGANEAGIRGAAEIAALLPDDTTDICVSVGTGTTWNGLLAAVPALVRVHGFHMAQKFWRPLSGQKKFSGMDKPIKPLSILTVHDPRFGKWTEEAAQFLRTFFQTTGIPLDVVYTSKMMMKVASLLQDGFFSTDSKIVCIHTGGLQGNPVGLFKH